MKLHSRAIAPCALALASTAAWPGPPRPIELTDIAGNPSLAGKRVTLRACMLIP